MSVGEVGEARVSLRVLAAQRGWRRWTLASFLARLPTTMTLLALLLAGEQATGSLAVGAQLAGVATVISGLAAPWRSRRLDRGELRVGLRRATAIAAAVFLVEAGAYAAAAPSLVLFALAAVHGVAVAALSGGYRALLVPVVSPQHLARANTLEAVFVEVAFVSGPAVAGILAVVVGGVGVLGAMAISAAAASVVTRGLPTLEPVTDRPPFDAWADRRARAVYGISLALGFCVGLLESAVPARLEELGRDPELGGPLLALVALSSGVGGLVGGALVERTRDPRRPAVVLLAAFGVLLAPLGAVGSVPPLALLLVLCGAPIAPLNALGSMVLQRSVPAGRQAEGFSLFIAAVLIGAGAGQAVTGLLLESAGAQVLLVGSAVVPLALAAVAAWSSRRRTSLTSP